MRVLFYPIPLSSSINYRTIFKISQKGKKKASLKLLKSKIYSLEYYFIVFFRENKKGLRRAPKERLEINIQVFQEDGTCCAYKFQRLVG